MQCERRIHRSFRFAARARAPLHACACTVATAARSDACSLFRVSRVFAAGTPMNVI